jgi:MFS family permease
VPPHITNEDSVWYIKLDDTEMSIVGSFVNLGALLGALTGGFLMDRFGRKMVLIFLSLPFVLGWLLIAVAVHPSKQKRKIHVVLCLLILAIDFLLSRYVIHWSTFGWSSWRHRFCGGTYLRL